MKKIVYILLCGVCLGSLVCAVTGCRQEEKQKAPVVRKAPAERLYGEKEVRILLLDQMSPEMILADHADKMTYDGVTYLAANGLNLNPELISRTLDKGSLPVVTYILERENNYFDTKGDAIRLMHLFSENNRRMHVGILIAKGVKPTGKVFLKSCSEGDYTLVKLMLQNGIDANVKDADGNTALHLAAASKDLLSVKLLVEAGADLTARDKNGKTPADLAATDKLRKYFEELNTKPEQSTEKIK